MNSLVNKKIAILGMGYITGPIVSELKVANEMSIFSRSTGFDLLEKSTWSALKNINDYDALIWSIPIRDTDSLENFESLYKNYLSNISSQIYISTTSVFGKDQAICDESTTPIPTTYSGKRYHQWEMFLQAQPEECSIKIIRSSGQVDLKRNALTFFQKKRFIPRSHDPINLIHSDDLREMIKLLLCQKSIKLLNAVSRDEHKKCDFYNKLREHFSLPLLHVESTGGERKIVSTELVKLNYVLRFPSLYDFYIDQGQP